MCEDPTAEVCAAAASTFTRVAESGVISDQDVQLIVRRLVETTKGHLRRTIGNILAAICEVPEHGTRLSLAAMGQLLAELRLQVHGADAKNVVLSALGQIAPRGHTGAVHVLFEVAVSDPDPSVRLAALDALRVVALFGDVRLRQAALQLVTDQDEVVGEAAAELLEELGYDVEDADAAEELLYELGWQDDEESIINIIIMMMIIIIIIIIISSSSSSSSSSE